MPTRSFLRLISLVLLGLLSGGGPVRSWAQPSAGAAVVVKTRQGRLQGTREANLCVFRGIPYAQPPVGALRFRPPQAPKRHRAIYAAGSFGPRATQVGGPTGVQGSEDCLYLNVWAPAWPAAARPSG